VQFAVARFNPGGCVDQSFGQGGLVLTPFEQCAGAHAAVLQPDGALVAAGQASVRTVPDFAVVRYVMSGGGALACGGGGGGGGGGIPDSCGAPAATFESVACRLDALVAYVAGTDLGKVKQSLLNLAGRAGEREALAASHVGSQKTKQARNALRAAAKALKRFGARIRSKAGRKAITDPTVRDSLLATASRLEDDVQALRNAL
jgi:hypothetical protein